MFWLSCSIPKKSDLYEKFGLFWSRGKILESVRKNDNHLENDNELGNHLETSRKFWDRPEIGETSRQLWDRPERENHLEISAQFWDRSQFGKSSGYIRAVLRPSANWEIIWKHPDSFETLRKLENHIETSGQLKNQHSFETVWKLSNHLAKILKVLRPPRK